MTDYSISLRTEPAWTAYAIETRDGRKSEQIVRFAPGYNTPENVLSVALSDLLVRIENSVKPKNTDELPLQKIIDYPTQYLAKKFSISVPWCIGDDTVFEKVLLFGEVELRME